VKRRALRSGPPSTDRRMPQFVILTGLSGSGKSQAIRALEDLGYFCVDNLPVTLIPTMADLAHRQGLSRVAIVVDVRERAFLKDFARIFRRLRTASGIEPRLIFLEASDSTLVRRFSETRRPHPLAPDRSVSEGILDERAQLQTIRRMADQIIDTSDLTVHELRQAFMRMSRGRTGRAPLVVTLLSFGFKRGIPMDADLVFDVRFLPNPHFVAALRPLSGRDRDVVKFMEQQPATGEFLDHVVTLLKFLIPQYVSEGKSYLTIAIGCTGGRHRSVMIAESLRRSLLTAAKGVRVGVRHRDIDNE
jgi:RNase adapter protein RapZ